MYRYGPITGPYVIKQLMTKLKEYFLLMIKTLSLHFLPWPLDDLDLDHGLNLIYRSPK